MPHTDSDLPFSGSTPTSRHASYTGAKAAETRAPSQVLRMVSVFADCRTKSWTDHELAAFLAIPLASVCARRSLLVQAGLVKPDGFAVSPVDPEAKNTRWIWAK